MVWLSADQIRGSHMSYDVAGEVLVLAKRMGGKAYIAGYMMAEQSQRSDPPGVKEEEL